MGIALLGRPCLSSLSPALLCAWEELCPSHPLNALPQCRGTVCLGGFDRSALFTVCVQAGWRTSDARSESLAASCCKACLSARLSTATTAYLLAAFHAVPISHVHRWASVYSGLVVTALAPLAAHTTHNHVPQGPSFTAFNASRLPADPRPGTGANALTSLRWCPDDAESITQWWVDGASHSSPPYASAQTHRWSACAPSRSHYPAAHLGHTPCTCSGEYKYDAAATCPAGLDVVVRCYESPPLSLNVRPTSLCTDPWTTSATISPRPGRTTMLVGEFDGASGGARGQVRAHMPMP